MTTHCWCGQPLTDDQIRRGNKTCCGAHGRALQQRLPIEVRKRWVEKANASRRQQCARRIIGAIVADLKPLASPDGKVDVRDAAKIVFKHRRLGYVRGWSANYARRMRAISVV